jgi:lantibiotic modifying enzyme
VLPEFGGNQQLGYAHGTAGIADALLDLADATGDDAIRTTALDAGRWLIDQAEQGPNGSVAFPSEAGGRPWAPLWCHGPTGIGRFLLHLHRSGGLEPEHRWMLTGTGVAAARHGRTLGPVMCHGIAGSVDHLLDLHQVEPTAGHLAEAWSLAELLESFHVEGDDGQLRTLSDHPGVSTPDLTVGYAGIATVWLRLADPALPTLLAGRA